MVRTAVRRDPEAELHQNFAVVGVSAAAIALFWIETAQPDAPFLSICLSTCLVGEEHGHLPAGVQNGGIVSLKRRFQKVLRAELHDGAERLILRDIRLNGPVLVF